MTYQSTGIYKVSHNGLQIGDRFNAANVLLGVWFLI